MSNCFFTMYDIPDVSILPSYTRILHWGNHATCYFSTREEAEICRKKFIDKHPAISQIVVDRLISPNLLNSYHWINGIETVFPYGKGPQYGTTH